MQFDAQQLLAAALQIPETERFELVARLLDETSDGIPCSSLDDEDLVAQLDRRFADRAGAVDWKDLRAES